MQQYAHAQLARQAEMFPAQRWSPRLAQPQIPLAQRRLRVHDAPARQEPVDGQMLGKFLIFALLVGSVERAPIGCTGLLDAALGFGYSATKSQPEFADASPDAQRNP